MGGLRIDANGRKWTVLILAHVGGEGKVRKKKKTVQTYIVNVFVPSIESRLYLLFNV